MSKCVFCLNNTLEIKNIIFVDNHLQRPTTNLIIVTTPMQLTSVIKLRKKRMIENQNKLKG